MVNSTTIKRSTEQKAPEASSTTNTAKGSFVNTLSQTLTAANAYLVSLLSQAGLKDLVPSHGDILVALFAQETVTMQELSEKIHRDPSTITALVKKLVLGGYVQTQKSVTDKRRTEVSLTSKGKSLRSTFETISTTLVNTQMEGIDADAFAITCATLNRSELISSQQIKKKKQAHSSFYSIDQFRFDSEKQRYRTTKRKESHEHFNRKD